MGKLTLPFLGFVEIACIMIRWRVLKTVLHLSDKTEEFTNHQLMMIGGHALRAFAPLSRFIRGCDFALMKKNGWNIDNLKTILPEGYLIKEEGKK